MPTVEQPQSAISQLHGLSFLSYRCGTDARRTMVRLNDQCLAVTGYEPDALLDNREISFAEIIHPDDFEPLRGQIAIAVEQGQPIRASYRLLSASGAERLVLELGHVVQNDADDGGEIEGTITDISGFGLEHYSDVFDQAPVSIWDEDWSALKGEVESLRERGIEDLRAYFRQHLDEVANLGRLVQVNDFNQTTVTLYGARNKDAIRGNVGGHFSSLSLEGLLNAVVDFSQSKVTSTTETTDRTFDGKPIEVRKTYRLSDGCQEDWSQVIMTIQDVADTRRAEDRFERLLDAAPDAMVIVDGKGGVERINRQTERLFGYSSDELVGQPVETLLAERYREDRYGDHQNILTRARAQSSKAGLELGGLAKDGTEFPIEISLSPLETVDGTLRICAIRDITERKVAEDALVAQKAVLEATMENMDQGISMFDSDLRIITYNTKFAELLDFPSDVIEADSSLAALFRYNALRGDYGPGDTEVKVQERMELARKFEPHHFERTRPDGTVIEIRGNPVQTGGFVTTYTDITERKKAEADLAAKEAQLRIAMDNMPGGMFMIDAESNIALVNKQYQELFDFPKGLLVEGHPIANMVRFQAERGDYGPGDVENLAAEMSERRARKKHNHYERELASGKVLEINLAPTPEGGTVAVAADITERKRAEDALRESEGLLKTVLDNMPAIVFLKSLDGKFRLINSRYEEVYGVRFDEIRNKVLHEIYPAELADKFTAIDQKVISTGEVIESEHVVSMADRDITLASVMFPIQGQGDSVTGFGGVEIDITERKKAEDRFRSLLESAPDATVIVDADGDIVQVNHQTEKLFGFAADELLGQPVEILVPAHLRKQHPKHRTAFFGPSKARPMGEGLELFGVTKDGREFPIEISLGPIETQEEILVSASVRDITERKKAEAALRESQTRLQTVLDNMPAVAFLRDRNDRFVLINKQYEEVYGVHGADIEGKTLHDIFSEEVAEEFASQDRQVLKTGMNVEAEIMMPVEGGERVFTAIRFPIFDASGEIVSIGGVELDITARKEAEKALEEIKERFTLATEAANVGLWDANVPTGKAYYSDKWMTMLGYEPDELPRHVETWEKLLHPDDKVSTISTFEHNIADNDPSAIYQTEFRLRAKDGSYRWISSAGSIVEQDDAGRPRRLAGIHVDITDKKIAEEELRRAKDSAEKALSELKIAQVQLIEAEKMASLGQLTAGIAHEIKNPLNFVNNFSETSIELLDELRETLEPVRDRLEQNTRDEVDDVLQTLSGDLRKIDQHGKRADGIVKSMLMHSRGDVTDRVATSVAELAEEALNLAYHGERARDKAFLVNLETQFDDATGEAELVPQEIIRVFVNLFSNAFYAVKKQREALEGSDCSPTVFLSTHDRGQEVEVRVRDNGIGMTQEVRDRLFEPFYTTKPTGEGTGLGMSMSYDIITKQHGGRIEIESEPGKFTEFVITLPRQQTGAEADHDGGSGK
jgi:PAS domain S-box-containing protein